MNEVITTSSEENITIDEVGSRPLLQQYCARLNMGSNKMIPTSKAILELGRLNKQACSNKSKPNQYAPLQQI